VLVLPKTHKMPLDQIEKYNKLSRKVLIAV